MISHQRCSGQSHEGLVLNWVSHTASVLQDSMTAAQREAYEDSKLKMRKAMADTALIDELEEVMTGTCEDGLDRT